VAIKGTSVLPGLSLCVPRLAFFLSVLTCSSCLPTRHPSALQHALDALQSSSYAAVEVQLRRSQAKEGRCHDNSEPPTTHAPR
jgi:hypothetical protein